MSSVLFSSCKPIHPRSISPALSSHQVFITLSFILWLTLVAGGLAFDLWVWDGWLVGLLSEWEVDPLQWWVGWEWASFSAWCPLAIGGSQLGEQVSPTKYRGVEVVGFSCVEMEGYGWRSRALLSLPMRALQTQFWARHKSIGGEGTGLWLCTSAALLLLPFLIVVYCWSNWEGSME